MQMADFFAKYGDRLVTAIFTHLFYVLVSVAVGFVIALIFGIILSRFPKQAQMIIPVISIFQTVPGIVFIGLLFLYTGMEPITVIIALAIYAIFPILKNTLVGIGNVDIKYKEAAKGCGMSNFQVLTKVELPLAMPTIIGGLRISTVYTVSWAVLASMIGLGGLGDFIYTGVSSNNNVLIIAGAVPAAIMAIILSAIIDRLQKAATPKGMRGAKK